MKEEKEVLMKQASIGNSIQSHLDNMSISKSSIERNTKVQYYQLEGILRGDRNYTITSLLKVLNNIGLEIIIKPSKNGR